MGEGSRGEVRIADHVVAIVASVAAQEISGIQLIASGFYEDLSKRVSGKTSTKGVAVHVSEGETSIDMRVHVQYGLKIDQVCYDLQRKVKEMVESLTGLYVSRVNVRVDGILAQ